MQDRARRSKLFFQVSNIICKSLRKLFRKVHRWLPVVIIAIAARLQLFEKTVIVAEDSSNWLTLNPLSALQFLVGCLFCLFPNS